MYILIALITLITLVTLITLMNIYIHSFDNPLGTSGERQYLQKFFLSYTVLSMIRDMKRQFAQLLSEMGFLREGASVCLSVSVSLSLSVCVSLSVSLLCVCV